MTTYYFFSRHAVLNDMPFLTTWYRFWNHHLLKVGAVFLVQGLEGAEDDDSVGHNVDVPGAPADDHQPARELEVRELLLLHIFLTATKRQKVIAVDSNEATKLFWQQRSDKKENSSKEEATTIGSKEATKQKKNGSKEEKTEIYWRYNPVTNAKY